MITIKKKYYFDNEESFERPSLAFNTAPIYSDEQFISLGGRIDDVEVEEPDPAPRTTCTKYEFINALKAVDNSLFEQLRTLYSTNSDLQFYWNTIIELDRNNEDFQTFADYAGVTSGQLDEIFDSIM